MYLNLYSSGAVWKSFDWAATDRLFEKGFISDPVGKANPKSMPRLERLHNGRR
ncbi:MAG: DUF6429 family protein [Alphaproteobacteria bacterium]|nr:DUF6429 family protein [Alphaproteobacteria bacterium]